MENKETFLTFFIKPRAPYNFALAIDFMARENSASRNKKKAEQKLTKVFRIGGRPVPAIITSVGTVEQPKLEITTVKLTERRRTTLIEKITDFLLPDTGLTGVYAAMEKDGKLRRLKKRFYGFVIPKMADTIYEGVIRAIIQQQIALIVANRITETMIRHFGEKVRFAGETLYTFPEPKVLAKADIADLRACGLSARKAESIIDFSQAVAGKGFDAEALRDDSEEDVIKKLTAFRGIGLWTAELVMTTCMSRNSVPAGDLGVRNTISKYFFDGVLQAEQTVRDFTKQWGTAASVISIYLIYAYVSGVERL
jgi:DNA-3-methyladenine glycosylase II